MKCQSQSLRSAVGFSMIELMVAVSIIGVLSAIAVPNFTAMQAKARQSDARSVLSSLYMAEKIFVSDWGRYYADFMSIGFCPEGTHDYRFGFPAPGGNNSPTAAQGYPATGIGGGPAPDTAPAVFVSTPGGWGVGPNACASLESARARPLAAGAVTAVGPPPTFRAAATSNIDNDNIFDTWTIDNTNRLLNPTSDL